MPLIQSISGLRGTLGTSLSPHVIARHAVAAAAVLPDGHICIGTDGRPSGEWIRDIVVGALRACGRTVHVLGTVPTPTVQLNVEQSSAAGGIIITASHNPAEWNGLKFLGPDGVFLSPDKCSLLWEYAGTDASVLRPEQQAGTVINITTAIDDHIGIVRRLPATLNLPPLQSDVIVVDAVNASGSVIVPRLLQRLGYSVAGINCNGSGVFPHKPEPIPENLTELAQAVTRFGACMGIAVDPDADRLVLIDETGTPIGEEYTVTLATLAVLDAMPDPANASVVVNYSTTRMVDDIAELYGAVVHRSAVGEINVVNKMRSVGAVIGGEGSGGVIYPECHSGRDAMVGIALITSHLRRKGISLRGLCNTIPAYHMVKQKIELHHTTMVPTILRNVAEMFSDARLSFDDGLHAAWGTHWVHVRSSNTEPIMRIIAEAPTREQALELARTVTSIATV